MHKKISLFVLVGFISMTALFAQSKNEKVDIKTSAVCSMCKQTIEEAVYNLEGVKAVYLDVESKVATIKFDGTKLEKEAIIKAITMAGYDADELLADSDAYNNLNACCKKDAVH